MTNTTVTNPTLPTRRPSPFPLRSCGGINFSPEEFAPLGARDGAPISCGGFHAGAFRLPLLATGLDNGVGAVSYASDHGSDHDSGADWPLFSNRRTPTIKYMKECVVVESAHVINLLHRHFQFNCRSATINMRTGHWGRLPRTEGAETRSCKVVDGCAYHSMVSSHL